MVGISFRRRDQLKHDLIWGILGYIVQINDRFGLSDRIEVPLDYFRMRAGNGRMAEKTKGRPLHVLSAIK